MKNARSLSKIVCLVCAGMLYFAVLLFSMGGTAFHAHAATGSVSSSPTSGPVGATIQVSGYGWLSVPDGTSVFFGYSTNSNCNSDIIVANSQLGTIHGGAFNGWFHWPSGTLLNTYMVCAVIGSVTAPANTYDVLSPSPPQINISSSTLVVDQVATLSGSNYFPSSTNVPLFLQSASVGNTFQIGSVISDVNGSFTLTFAAPASMVGADIIVANAGKGDPPTLSATLPVTVKSISHSPPPTPTPGPNPNPTPGFTPTTSGSVGGTQMLTPTQPATTPTAITATPTSGSTIAPSATQNPGPGQTPTAGTLTGSNSNSPGAAGTTTTGRQTLLTPLTIGIGAGVLLLAFCAIALLLARRRRAGPVLPLNPNPSGLPAWGNGSMPANDMLFPNNGQAMPASNGMILMSNLPMQFLTPLKLPDESGTAYLGQSAPEPIPVASGVNVNEHTLPATGGAGGTQVDHAGVSEVVTVRTPAQHPVPLDPAIEAVMRQAQAGLFATPREH